MAQHTSHRHDGQDHHHDHDHDRHHGHDHGHEHGPAHDHAPAPTACCGSCGSDAPAVITVADEPVPPGMVITAVRIGEMDCPTEEALIRKALGAHPAVGWLRFNLMQRVLTLAHQPQALDDLLALVRGLGLTPEPLDAAPQAAPGPVRRGLPLALAGVFAAAAEAVEFSRGGPDWLIAALAVVAILLAGLGTYRKGWIAIRHLTLNINALMSIAVTGAMLIGQWPEAAMVMVLFTLAEWIEARSLDRARNAVSGLLALSPPTASVETADGWAERDAAQVPVGARVRVRPGERVALDGEVESGQSAVDQAAITGESLPVEKGIGDTLFAGTVNTSGELVYRVTATGGNSTLARIIHAIEEAQGARAPTQRFVDRFAAIYTPAVLVFAILVALLPPLLSGGAWLEWSYRALVLLVIACPCALVISTPVTIVSGLALAARRGILIKGGTYLEQGRRLGWIALDKTGTLTAGRPVRTDFAPQGDTPPAHAERLAVSLATRSDHPVSQAIADGRSELAAPVDGFTALPGRGVHGTIDGQTYWLGNHRLIEERGVCSPAIEAQLQAFETAGKSTVLLASEHEVLGLFAVADTLRPESREAIAQLHALGVRTLMLSGDNQHTVTAIAGQVGIDEARGNQLPADKLAAIESLLARDASVGMVGDGINDAPALARADIGFAMGAAGSDTAIETADVALMNDDLRKLPAFVRLSRATHNILVQNISVALGIKAIFLVLTRSGMGTMWMAVFADVGASLLVVGNGLRLLRHR